MKKTIKNTLLTMVVWVVFVSPLMAQVAGNANFINMKSNMQYQVAIPATNINIPYVNSNFIEVNIKGMANVKADAYVAIFNLKQAGETAAEVNKLIDAKIAAIENAFNGMKDVETYVDLLSFVPIYEVDVVKKLFSKTTYNEIPKGFEVQKNLHIKYKDPNLLNKIMAVCSENEIYNLVRVDLFSDSIEQIKKAMIAKAQGMLLNKLDVKIKLLKIDQKDYDRKVTDGFRMVYPVEMYKSYQAYSGDNSFNKVSVSSSVKRAKKATTFYYKPVIDKEFDFVKNPVVFVPVIQVMYEVKILLTKKPKPVEKPKPPVKKEIKVQKEFILITPKGEVKPLTVSCP